MRSFRAASAMSACSICLRLRSRRRKTRLADGAAKVRWIAADVTTWLPDARYDIWHNRAAFHFLAAPDAQRAYVARLKLALRGGGHAIIATFALEGPKKCSGLPVTRHSAETIGALLGLEFALIDTRRHQHLTPWGSVQKFQFSTFVRVVDKSARATSLQSSDATAPREAMSRLQLLGK
jgi:hypothetical protein